MQLGSSIGLSLFIHIGIILWHRVIGLFPKKKTTRPLYRTKTGALGITIVTVVSIIILGGALAVIKVSVTEKHSSIYFVYDYIRRTQNYMSPQKNYVGAPLALASTNSVSNLSAAPATPLAMKTIAAEPTECNRLLRNFQSINGGSITDYLQANGRDNSFASRAELAKEMGIGNYMGTFQQNEILLVRLYMKFHGLSENYYSVCH